MTLSIFFHVIDPNQSMKMWVVLIKLSESVNGSRRYERHWGITPAPSNVHQSKYSTPISMLSAERKTFSTSQNWCLSRKIKCVGNPSFFGFQPCFQPDDEAWYRLNIQFNRISTLSMDQKFIALHVKAKRTYTNLFRFSVFPSLLFFSLFGTSGVPAFIHSWFQWTIWCIRDATHVLTGLCYINIWADGVIQLRWNERREWNWKIL